MIAIGLKFTNKVDIETPILGYLALKYGKEEAAKHARTINEFQVLRTEVASITMATEGARATLIKYLAVSAFAKDRFPVSESAIKINFSWTDALKQKKTVSQFSWAFERASVLFNLAACSCALGVGTSRTDLAGIEAAAKHFSCAAGILERLRDAYAPQVHGALPYDLSPGGLNFFIQLMLAQAQACSVEMARMRGTMKSEILARLAIQAADFYRGALRALTPAVLADMDSDFPWSVYCQYWTACFDAAAFFEYSKKAFAEAEAAGKGYGHEIAWLTTAENAARAAIGFVQNSRNKLAAGVSTEGATQLASAAGQRRVVAVRDNSVIYVNVVPPVSDLPEIPRATLAKVIFPPDIEVASPDMFKTILPVEVIASMGRIDERLREEAGQLRDTLNAASETARRELGKLGLPGYLDANDGAGLPAAVWERVSKTQIEGGIRELERLFSTNAGTAEGLRVVLRQVSSTLDEEAAADAALRGQFRDRWTTAPSDLVAADLRGDHAKFAKVADVAEASSDGQVRSKLEANRARIAALSRPRAELEASVPAAYNPVSVRAGSAVPASEADAVRSALKGACAELQALIDARARIAADAVDRFDTDAAAATLFALPPAQHVATIDELFAKYTAPRAAVAESLTAQDTLLARVASLHARFGEVRAQDERTRARERAIQEICESVDRFEELRSNMREGAEFYRTLKGHADALLVSARDLAAARSLQARELQLNIRQADERSATAAVTAGFAGISVSSSGPGSSSAAAYPSVPGGPGAVAVPLPPGPPAAGVVRATSVSMMPAATVAPAAFNPFAAAAPPPAHHAPAPHYVGPGSYAAPAPQQAYPASFPAPAPAYFPPQPAPAPAYCSAAPPAPAPAYFAAPPAAHFSAPAPAAAPPMPGGGPIPPQLQQMMNMGFDRARADQALRDTNGNVELAVAQLFSAP